MTADECATKAFEAEARAAKARNPEARATFLDEVRYWDGLADEMAKEVRGDA